MGRHCLVLCIGSRGGLGSARRVFLWVRPCPGLGRSGGIQWGVGRPAGGRDYFLLRVRGALFFAVCARQVHSLTCCRPPPSIHCRKASRVRGVFFFAAGARRVFVFAVGARQVHSLTCCRAPPSIHCRTASRVRGAVIFAAGARALGGGVYFFAAGARRDFFFAVGARPVHSLTCCRPPPSVHCRKTSRVRGAFMFLLRVRSLTHSLTHSLPAARRAPTAKKHTQQKKTRVPTD